MSIAGDDPVYQCPLLDIFDLFCLYDVRYYLLFIRFVGSEGVSQRTGLMEALVDLVRFSYKRDINQSD